ncbi:MULTISPECIES: nucleoside deaminase [unclassified Saccharibacter]|uniref:nucleoside deaminase n=1 Tax=unclassified Saccharibacter TaxID=2648722 RepID=UPI001327F577|nr:MULTISPECIES: nucleoside deaminase [unclassified Saccharibacter]MXV35160.1 nucleoside deaminase [Saccharibacter sp. EH611]MXV57293.1 nucleoside deaminase [Saccharibacter sp. EH70]MXV64846.1 nucleoside deaminase [Saccharibacter sp. EH60]
MQQALSLAREASSAGEVPVGAVVLSPKGGVLSVARNQVEGDYDGSAHAELLAMRRAASVLGSARLVGCTLIVTLEPCPMCAAAISHFRVARLAYGAYDPKGGAVDHGPRLFQRDYCLHKPEEVISGLCEREAGALLTHFFQLRRSRTIPSITDVSSKG